MNFLLLLKQNNANKIQPGAVVAQCVRVLAVQTWRSALDTHTKAPGMDACASTSSIQGRTGQPS